MLKILGTTSMYTKTPTYQNVRCCRVLAEVAGKVFADCEEDIKVFKRMSPRMRSCLQSRGIADYVTTMRFVKGMQQILAQYTINDLIIYTCLLDEVVFDT